MNKHTLVITIDEEKKGSVFIECKEANIAQNFLIEDVAGLIIDLPNLSYRCNLHLLTQLDNE